jgi:HAE1 family hydrophobic/amphiphilic exporter-1/multidrug efflux pump
MTSMAFILGVFPLVVASGAGAASRHSIGTGVFGGMLAATFLAIFFVPLFFVLIGKITQRIKKTPVETMQSGVKQLAAQPEQQSTKADGDEQPKE